MTQSYDQQCSAMLGDISCLMNRRENKSDNESEEGRKRREEMKREERIIHKTKQEISST